MDTILKKIEIKAKKIISKLIYVDRKTYKLSEIRDVFYFDNTPKILLLRHDRIGDVIVSTSFIRILRNKYPNAVIDILLSYKNISAKKSIEKYINNIWILEKAIPKYFSLLRKLNRNKYDLIIDLFDNTSTTSSIIIKYANPTFALGIEKNNAHCYDYTVPMLDKRNSHIIERICNLLIAFGINPITKNLELEYPTDAPPKLDKIRIGINIAGGAKERFWGLVNNDKLINYLYSRFPNCEIRIFYTSLYTYVVDELRNKYPTITTGILKTFDDFANEVAKCKLIITPDTSIVHLASAIKIPIVVLYLFGINYISWYPYHTKYRAIETRSDNLTNILPEIVFNSIEELMKDISE
jgi:ADP-heptose:LPS heptosyltransferase